MELKVPMKDVIIPKYKDLFLDIMQHKHTHYVLAGGRGSTKSSFIGLVIPLLLIQYPNTNAVCFRKIANTIQKSIYSQIVWGIHHLGLESQFKIPQTYASPIVFKPTGQQIIFMGLDDPMKTKSIKLPKGYLAITWFEELDQYAGENELRTVTQSTMRGGEMFWDFRSFNPPISKNNWANEYAEGCEIDTEGSTLVIRNTYLDVPADWLGPQFIEEAEELKRKNPRAYQHEYGGEAIGTGGDVFQNAQDLDMEQLVQIKDAYGNVIDERPMWQTFDHIYNGIDWGFAIDPTRFVKMHFDKRNLDLYIFAEYTTIKNRIETIYKALYQELKLVRNDDLVIADRGGGGSFAVADFKAYGAFIREAIKGPESVNYGIKWLQGLNHIYIDKRKCPDTYKEFINYEYEQDKDGNFISAYPDENNHSIDAARYALERYCNRKGN